MTDELKNLRDELAEQYVYMHCPRTEGRNVKIECYKQGFDAGVAKMQAQIDELKEYNSNCISRSLHEARMRNVEQELDLLKAEVERHKDLLRKQCNHSQDLQEAFDIVTNSGPRKRRD